VNLLARVVAIDEGIVEWLARRERARRKEKNPPSGVRLRGSPPKSTGLGVVSGEGAAQSAYVL
jgi:hypothetical protein